MADYGRDLKSDACRPALQYHLLLGPLMCVRVQPAAHPGAYFVSPAYRLSSPQTINSAEFLGIEALHQKVRKQRPRLARQSHCLLNQLL